MDVRRPERAARIRRKRVYIIAFATVLSAVVIAATMRLDPALPTVARESVWIGKVERGEMLREVRGQGTLVPENVLVVPTEVGGRVVKIDVLPGTWVDPATVLLELSNPPLRQQAFELEWQVEGAQAKLRQLKVQLDEARLELESSAAKLESELKIARLEAKADETLEKDGLVPALVMQRSQASADDLDGQLQLAKERLVIAVSSSEAQLAVQQSEIKKLEAALELKKKEVEQLKVHAGIEGVVQQIGSSADEMLQIGESVAAGSVLAKIVQPTELMAQVKIAETQAKDVLIGQPVLIDTRNGAISGKVVRVDPSVVNGTVTVDVELEGTLPKGARPDLSVEGVIELERLPDVTFVNRPVQGQEGATLGLFKLVEDGFAVRVPVEFGRSSVSTIELVKGLSPNDRVILSDMSDFDGHDRIKLN